MVFNLFKVLSTPPTSRQRIAFLMELLQKIDGAIDRHNSSTTSLRLANARHCVTSAKVQWVDTSGICTTLLASKNVLQYAVDGEGARQQYTPTTRTFSPILRISAKSYSHKTSTSRATRPGDVFSYASLIVISCMSLYSHNPY